MQQEREAGIEKGRASGSQRVKNNYCADWFRRDW